MRTIAQIFLPFSEKLNFTQPAEAVNSLHQRRPRYCIKQLMWIVSVQACSKGKKSGGGQVVMGGDNVSPLVETGLTDLSKSVGAAAPPPASHLAACLQCSAKLQQADTYLFPSLTNCWENYKNTANANRIRLGKSLMRKNVFFNLLFFLLDLIFIFNSNFNLFSF